MTAKDRPATGPEETPTAGSITTRQMRHLHALLRDHGITGDKAVHDYLTVALEHPVESRTELTAVDAAGLIAELEAAPRIPGAPTIVEALAAVMSDVQAVGKDSQAPGNIGGFKFRGIDAVVNAVAPALRAHGVVMVPEVLHVERVTTQTKAGNPMLNVYVTTRYTFHGPAGDSLSTTVQGEASDAGDKATSKAQSVALRVALLQALMLPTDEPDPDMDNYERGNQQPAPPPWTGPSVQELVDLISGHAITAGVDLDTITAKWRAAHNVTGGETALLLCPPYALAQLEASIADYLTNNPQGAPSDDHA